MAVKYKQLCSKCKKNYVLVTWKDRYPTCYQCQQKELNSEVDDPEMKKFFDIPEEFYKKSSFLRDIKLQYLRFESISDRQKEAFLETVKKMKEQ